MSEIQQQKGESDADYIRHAAKVIEGLSFRSGDETEMASELRFIAARMDDATPAPRETIRELLRDAWYSGYAEGVGAGERRTILAGEAVDEIMAQYDKLAS